MKMPQAIYDDYVARLDIRGLIHGREFGLRGGEPQCQMATDALARIGVDAIPALIEALDEIALEARIAVVQQRTGRGVFASAESFQNPISSAAADIEIQRNLDSVDFNPCFPEALALVRIGKPSILPLAQYLHQDRD